MFKTHHKYKFKRSYLCYLSRYSLKIFCNCSQQLGLSFSVNIFFFLLLLPEGPFYQILAHIYMDIAILIAVDQTVHEDSNNVTSPAKWSRTILEKFKNFLELF